MKTLEITLILLLLLYFVLHLQEAKSFTATIFSMHITAMSLTFKCQLEEFVIDLLFFPMNIKGCCFNEFRSQFFSVFLLLLAI